MQQNDPWSNIEEQQYDAAGQEGGEPSPENSSTQPNSSDDSHSPRGKPNPGKFVRVIVVGAIILALGGLFLVMTGMIRNYSENERMMSEYRREKGYQSIYENSMTASSQQPRRVEEKNVLLGDQLPMSEEIAVRQKQTRYEDNTAYNEDPYIKLIRDGKKKDEESEAVQGNSEIFAVLTIPGWLEKIVVRTENAAYYLSHDIYGSTENGGTVYAESSYNLYTPPENLILRGAAAGNGKCFDVLKQFLNRDAGMQYSANRIRLQTIYENREYELFAVLYANNDPDSVYYFDYASHACFETDEEMMAYVAACKERSLYSFPVTVLPTDRLVTLATVTTNASLYDGQQEGEVVLMYRMISNSGFNTTQAY